MKNNVVAVIGHRPHNLPWGQNERSPLCEHFKTVLQIRMMMIIDSGYDTFYTGMSRGIDLIFGEIIIYLKKKYPSIRLIGVLPYEGMHKNWQGSYQERYLNLIEACDDVVVLNKEYGENCFKQKNEYLVNHAERLVVVYDGETQKSRTYQTINMAKRRGRTITIMNLKTFSTRTSKESPRLRLLK